MIDRRLRRNNLGPRGVRKGDYKFVLIAPKGHVVSYHGSEKAAKEALYHVKGGCVIKPIEQPCSLTI